jgi:hypothetical protein
VGYEVLIIKDRGNVSSKSEDAHLQRPGKPARPNLFEERSPARLSEIDKFACGDGNISLECNKLY